MSVPFGIKRRHVDFRFAIDHHLGQIIPCATGSGDAKAEPFCQPHIAQPGRGADQWVAVWRVTDWAVEIVLQARFFARWHAVDHRHILFFDPFQIQREQIRAEAVWHAIFKHRRGVLFIDAQNPATAFFAHIGLRVGVANDGMFHIAIGAEFDQFGILIQHDKLVFDRNGRHLDAQLFRGRLRVVARSRDHMFCRDHDLFVGRDKIAALFHHLGAGDFPCIAIPMKRIGLPFAFDHYAPLARALCHRLCNVGGVNVAIRVVIQCALQIFGADQGPFRLDLVWGHPLIGHATGFCRCGIDHIFVHAFLRLRHTQVAHDRKPGVQPGFFFQ